jgi:hypothetical protein
MKNLNTQLILLVILIVSGCKNPDSQSYSIIIPDDTPQAAFAKVHIVEAFGERGWTNSVSNIQDASYSIYFLYADQEGQIEELGFDNPHGLEPDGFSLQVDNEKIGVLGLDAAGLMYGGLELAEQIELYGPDGLVPLQKNPYMTMRGTKFNIPLDVRTPTYTDPGDAAQKNIPEMWNFGFWKDYIDHLASFRYNFISLWSLHPFPSMVKVPGYEDIALNDVQRSTVEWQENYALQGTGFDAPEILANPEIIKQISIDDKIAFWKKVMDYGKSRNVDFYVVTWNIFTNGTKGQYGITDDINNETTRDYFRKSVKQMFVTYPDLAGIGLTTGENMHGASFEEKESWAFDTYAKGVLDAAAEMPDRKITFIHRQHMTGARDIAEKFKPIFDQPNVEFIFSFKYAKAHVMSAREQPYHEEFVKDIKGMKTIWTLRNDDNYYFRWGAPDFVREFIKNIPYDVSRGYYYGSDQWVWGREFSMKNAAEPRQIELEKHWYHWMLWGRLGYDPDFANDRIIKILEHRYPEVDGEKLFTAWQEASMIYPTTTGFHWGPLDFQWYIEGCKSRPAYAQNETGFHDVNRFINLPPHPRSGFQSIPEYVEMQQKGGSTDLLTPIQISDKLHAHSNKAIYILNAIGEVENPELNVTLHDIRTIARLGKYYAYKISGATNLAIYRATGETENQDAAICDLELALEAWKDYTKTAKEQNINPLWTNRVGYVDWIQITDWVADDIEIARE